MRGKLSAFFENAIAESPNEQKSTKKQPPPTGNSSTLASRPGGQLPWSGSPAPRSTASPRYQWTMPGGAAEQAQQRGAGRHPDRVELTTVRGPGPVARLREAARRRHLPGVNVHVLPGFQANQQVAERRQLAKHPARAIPELVATASRQVLSWDIAKLRRSGEEQNTSIAA